MKTKKNWERQRRKNRRDERMEDTLYGENVRENKRKCYGIQVFTTGNKEKEHKRNKRTVRGSIQ